MHMKMSCCCGENVRMCMQHAEMRAGTIRYAAALLMISDVCLWTTMTTKTVAMILMLMWMMRERTK